MGSFYGIIEDIDNIKESLVSKRLGKYRKGQNEVVCYGKNILLKVKFSKYLYDIYEKSNVLIITMGLIYRMDNFTSVLTKDIFILYEKYKEKFIEYIDGHFIIIIFDKLANNILIIRDRFGTRNLFYHIDKKNRFIFSNRIYLVLEDKQFKINEFSLQEIAIFGIPLKWKSLFQNVYIFPPGHYFRFNLRHKTLDIVKVKYLKFKKVKKIDKIENINKTILNNLKNVMKLYPYNNHKSKFSLSGGIDSAILLIVYRKIFKDITCSTFADSRKSQDLNFAKIITNYFNYTLNICFLKFKTLQENISDFILTIEDIPKLKDIYFYLYLRNLSNKSCKYLIVGEGADELFISRKYALINETYLNHLKYMNKLIKEKKVPISAMIKKSLIEVTKQFENKNDINNVFDDDFKYQIFMHNIQKINSISERFNINIFYPFLNYPLVNFINKIDASIIYYEHIPKYLLKRIILNRWNEPIVNIVLRTEKDGVKDYKMIWNEFKIWANKKIQKSNWKKNKIGKYFDNQELFVWYKLLKMEFS